MFRRPDTERRGGGGGGFSSRPDGNGLYAGPFFSRIDIMLLAARLRFSLASIVLRPSANHKNRSGIKRAVAPCLYLRGAFQELAASFGGALRAGSLLRGRGGMNAGIAGSHRVVMDMHR